ANFVGNHQDIDTCTLNSLYSICDKINIPIEPFHYEYPANIKRVLDIVSIPRSILWGSRSKFDQDFSARGNGRRRNIGDLLDNETLTLSSGETYVFENIFTGHYESIEIPTIGAQTTFVPNELSAIGLESPVKN